MPRLYARQHSPNARRESRGVPVLSGSKDNNFHIWAEAMVNKCTMEYGSTLGAILTTDELVMPKLPSISDYGIDLEMKQDDSETGPKRVRPRRIAPSLR